MEQIKREADRFPFLSQIEAKTNGKLKREYILILTVALLFILVLTTPISGLITSFFGLIIPFKETFTVLKQKKRREDEVQHLIVFWMIFSIVTALDAYSSFIIGFIPFYQGFKFVFLCWIGPLKFRAGNFIYERFLSRVPESWYSFESPDAVIEAAAKKVTEAVNNKDLKNVVKAINEESEHFKEK